MSDGCCTTTEPPQSGAAFRAERRVLWAALIINPSMFAIELAAGGLFLTGLRLYHGHVPQAEVMGGIGLLAIAANFLVLRLLIPFRQGDANRRAVWICTRNDVIGNVAVIIAATGVFTMVSGWPDAIVAAGLGVLGVGGGMQITRSALREQRTA